MSASWPDASRGFVLREKITHSIMIAFPSEIDHARGTGRMVSSTHVLSGAYTTAKILTEVWRASRFHSISTVAEARVPCKPHSKSAGLPSFYTKEGNWDLVVNNIPVFFIQDAIKFPDLIHAVKMEPDRGFPQAASAHDTFWDFISLTPESMHTVMWVMSDRTIPRSLRMVEAFGVHSFR